MDEQEKKVTTTQAEGVDESGKAVRQETQTVNTSSSAASRTVAENIVWFIFGAIGILLAFRFILKLFGANPNSGFVDAIYSVTDLLTAPFNNIFGVTTAAEEVNATFEPSILVAAAFYLLVAWAIVKLINIKNAQ